MDQYDFRGSRTMKGMVIIILAFVTAIVLSVLYPGSAYLDALMIAPLQ